MPLPIGHDQLESVDVRGVGVLRWNPRVPWIRRRRLRWTSHLPWAPRIANAGDLIGPDIVSAFAPLQSAQSRGHQLAAVGSTIHLLPSGTTVWGAGVNGKHLHLTPPSLDVRAVRGPLTRDYLRVRGISVPEVFGDPGLLIAHALPKFPSLPAEPNGSILVIPNLNEPQLGTTALKAGLSTLSPLSPLDSMINAIRSADLVIASSLHAIIFAEVLGRPTRALASSIEPTFKYLDYYEGTGRANVRLAENIDEAIRIGGAPRLDWDPTPTLNAFPSDLWNGS